MQTFLKSIEIRGYKSIDSIQLDLQAFNVLIGANGAGKSNLISLFRFLNQISSGNLAFSTQQSGGASALLHLGAKFTTQIGANLRFLCNQEVLDYEFELQHSPNGDLLLFNKDEFRFGQPESLKTVPLQIGNPESWLRPVSFSQDTIGQKAMQLRNLLERFRVYHFSDMSANAAIKLTRSLDDDVYLHSDGANLAAVLYRLKLSFPRHLARIVKTIQQSAPFFKDFVLEPVGNNIRLRYLEKNSDVIFGVHQMSDGTLRYIALLTLLLQPPELLPDMLLIDEPELGLHPHALETILAILQRLSKTRQVMIATQSVWLVNAVEPEQIIVAQKELGRSVFKRLDLGKLSVWLEEYSLGQLWESNHLGGRPSR
jgi:predicted ATPase